MTDDHRLRLALDTLHAGVRTLHESDAEMAADLAAALPDETEEVERAVVMLARAARHAKAMSDACSEMAKETAARATRLQTRSDRMRGLILAAMDTLGRVKIETSDLTVSLRAGQAAVIVTDESALADEYVRVTRAPDKATIREAMKQGVVVSGAEMANGLPAVVIKGT